ncbi:MAG: hypothetical protein QM725_06740 [Lacibacter sp.]
MIYSLKYFICILLLLNNVFAQPTHHVTISYSNKEQAILYLNSVKYLSTSKYWPEINPGLFFQNIKRNIETPDYLFAGRNTNFCSYAAIGYVFLQKDPLGYVQLMMDLYQNGEAFYGSTKFNPSARVRKSAGQILYEGELDRNEADQVLFFTLADHFKGYLNIFNKKYNQGDEQKIWASTNLSKFNRMLRAMFKDDIHSRGSDLIRPDIPNLVSFLNERLKQGQVYLYLNNSVLRRKNHYKTKKGIPTHYVVLLGISEKNNTATLTYWDTGYKTQKTINIRTFRWILYGISWSVNK